MRATTRVGVPSFDLRIEENRLFIEVERLAGMSDLSTIAELLSVATRKKWAGFEVVNFYKQAGGNSAIFILEDVATNTTLKVEQAVLNAQQYKIALRSDLTIDLEKSPHLGVFGRSGSGKTTTLLALLVQFLASKSSIVLIDGKNELTALDAYLTRADDLNSALKLLQKVVGQLVERQRAMSNIAQKKQVLGLTPKLGGLPPFILVIDELGALVAQADAKRKAELLSMITQIALKGRSVGIVLVVASQFANVETIPNAVRSQLSTRILLGSAPVELVKMTFPASAGGAQAVPAFEGRVFIEGQLGTEPSRICVPRLGRFSRLENWKIFASDENQKLIS